VQGARDPDRRGPLRRRQGFAAREVRGRGRLHRSRANVDSYLNISRIISAAEITDADAIHPGYGFLAENAHFAEVCQDCRITFIGPGPDIIRLMGDKAMARKTMMKAGVPVIPGSEGVVPTVEEAVTLGEEIGYPVIVKAAAGAGAAACASPGARARCAARTRRPSGKRPRRSAAASSTWRSTSRTPPHRVPDLRDKHGNIVHMNERECSIQRRHQKLVEEAPSVALTPGLRQKMAEAALAGRAWSAT
jgi:acetyl-CoA carboxylase biotin carboxylase subunit